MRDLICGDVQYPAPGTQCIVSVFHHSEYRYVSGTPAYFLPSSLLESHVSFRIRSRLKFENVDPHATESQHKPQGMVVHHCQLGVREAQLLKERVRGIPIYTYGFLRDDFYIFTQVNRNINIPPASVSHCALKRDLPEYFSMVDEPLSSTWDLQLALNALNPS